MYLNSYSVSILLSGVKFVTMDSSRLYYGPVVSGTVNFYDLLSIDAQVSMETQFDFGRFFTISLYNLTGINDRFVTSQYVFSVLSIEYIVRVVENFLRRYGVLPRIVKLITAYAPP